MLFDFLEKDGALIGLMALCSISAIVIMAATFTSADAPTHELYLTAYSSEVQQGEPIVFSLRLNDEKPAGHVMQVYIDGVPKGSPRSFTTKDQMNIDYSVPQDLEPGAHRLRIAMYDPSKPYDSYGSRYLPYELFFTVNVS